MLQPGQQVEPRELLEPNRVGVECGRRLRLGGASGEQQNRDPDNSPHDRKLSISGQRAAYGFTTSNSNTIALPRITKHK